jgi:hypothetical protein
MTSQPQFAAALTTARITAFKPGPSPPPVSTPIRWMEGRLIAAEDIPRV